MERLRITAEDPTLTLNETQARRIWNLLLEFIPAKSVIIDVDATATISVAGHGVDELAPAVRSDIEAALGCGVIVEGIQD